MGRPDKLAVMRLNNRRWTSIDRPILGFMEQVFTTSSRMGVARLLQRLIAPTSIDTCPLVDQDRSHETRHQIGATQLPMGTIHRRNTWGWPGRTNAFADHPKHGIDQCDLYQLYAYGKGYGCDAVALIYPRSQTFTNKDKLRYQILDDLTLICLPFDVEYPKESVQRSMEALTGAQLSSRPLRWPAPLCPTIPTSKCRRSAPSPLAKSQPGTASRMNVLILVKSRPAMCISIAWKPKEWN